MTVRKRSPRLLAILVLVVTLAACGTTKSPGARVGFSDPTAIDRLNKVFDPPWWYRGPVKSAYDTAFPPPWYQGSLEWMRDEVKEICNDEVKAMVRALADGGVTIATGGSPVAVVYGVVRIVGTGGVITYCRLKD